MGAAAMKKRIDLRHDLPEEIIQHIQSYLLEKDAARSSLLSKSWLHAQSTLSSLRFHQSRFGLRMVCQMQKTKDSSKTKELRRRFIKFVDDTLVRYHNSNLLVEKFDLSVEIACSKLVLDFDHVQRWLRSVCQKGLKHLSLTAICNDNISTLIPFEIFSCETLRTLKISEESWREPLRCACNPRIRCSSLQVLELQRVRINDKFMSELISNCPLLEEITLCDCDGFAKIHIRDLHHLRVFDISMLNSGTVEIDAPSLRSFTYSVNETFQRPCRFNIDASTSLTCLKLHSVMMKTRFFKKFISKFPLLERLIISDDFALQEMDIACPNLTELHILLCSCLKYVKVDAPKLVRFDYLGYPVPISFYFPSVDVDQLKANISLEDYDEFDDDSYLLWLSRTLHISRNITIQLTAIDLSVKETDLLYLRGNDHIRRLQNVKELYLWVANSRDSMYLSTIMDALFTLCHPRYIRANRYQEKNCNFLLIELMDRRTRSSCNFISNVEVSLTNKAEDDHEEEDDAKLLKVPWQNLIHGSAEHEEHQGYNYIRFTITWCS